MNIARYTVTLPVGMVLADLEAVEMFGNESEPLSVDSKEGDTEGDTISECPSVLLDGIDSTVPTEAREALDVLLRRFITTFSKKKLFGKGECGATSN